jgi:hypothetical protein
MVNYKTETERVAWQAKWYETIATWQETMRSER